MEEFVKLYYNGQTPDNVKVYFLKEKDYETLYKKLTKRFYGRIDADYKGTSGYCIKEPGIDIYHILIKNYGDEFENVHVLNLFHELSHVETMPLKIGSKLLCSSGKNKSNSIIGFEFWREYIAQYEAINQYQMKYSDIDFLYDKELTEKVLKRLSKNFEICLYEIVLYSEITNVYIKEAQKQTEELIFLLKKIKNGFKGKDDIRNINEKNIEQIGKKVKNLITVFNEMREQNG